MVKLDTLNQILKSQGSVRNLDKAQRLVDNLVDKIKLDCSANPMVKFNPDLHILIGRYVETKFKSESLEYKRDLILRVLYAVCSNVVANDKPIMSYLVECLLRGDFIKELSTSEYCMSYIADFLRRLI